MPMLNVSVLVTGMVNIVDNAKKIFTVLIVNTNVMPTVNLQQIFLGAMVEVPVLFWILE